MTWDRAKKGNFFQKSAGEEVKKKKKKQTEKQAEIIQGPSYGSQKRMLKWLPNHMGPEARSESQSLEPGTGHQVDMSHENTAVHGWTLCARVSYGKVSS